NPREAKINRKSVAELARVWSKDGLIGVSGTPTVAGGRAYFGDWTGTVWAVDAKTGQDIWSTKIGGGGFGFIVGAPTVDGDAVYVAVGGALYRLAPETGAGPWDTGGNEHEVAPNNPSPGVLGRALPPGTASGE